MHFPTIPVPNLRKSPVSGNAGHLPLQSRSLVPGAGQDKVVLAILRYLNNTVHNNVFVFYFVCDMISAGQGGGEQGVAHEGVEGRYCNSTVELKKILQGYCKT